MKKIAILGSTGSIGTSLIKLIKKDKKKGKSTLVALIGYEKANSYASKLKQNILKKLSKYGKKADNLINIVEFILERNF